MVISATILFLLPTVIFEGKWVRPRKLSRKLTKYMLVYIDGGYSFGSGGLKKKFPLNLESLQGYAVLTLTWLGNQSELWDVEALSHIIYVNVNYRVKIQQQRKNHMRNIIPLTKQELLTLLEYLSVPLDLSVTRPLVLRVMFCRSLFVLLVFFVSPL